MPLETIVCIRCWENQDDARDRYYAVPEHLLAEIQQLLRDDAHSPAARRIVEQQGRALIPAITLSVIEY